MSMDKSLRGMYRREAHIEPSRISTKNEVERLEALRATPSPVQHYRPKYLDHGAPDNALSRANERRLANQRRSLMVADFGFNRDRSRAVLKGFAKARFNARTLSKSEGHER